jgi:hypothetical protein
MAIPARQRWKLPTPGRFWPRRISIFAKRYHRSTKSRWIPAPQLSEVIGAAERSCQCGCVVNYSEVAQKRASRTSGIGRICTPCSPRTTLSGRIFRFGLSATQTVILLTVYTPKLATSSGLTLAEIAAHSPGPQNAKRECSGPQSPLSNSPQGKLIMQNPV